MNIIVDQGQPLYIEWLWQDATPDSPIDPLKSKMTISKDGEIKYTLILSGGLGISGINGLTKVQCDIVNTERIPSGEYQYSMSIVNDQGAAELEDSGTITIVSQDVEENNYAPRPWDYFYPRLTEEISQDTIDNRISICQSCNFYQDGQCKDNYAMIEDYASFQSSFCPIYKW